MNERHELLELLARHLVAGSIDRDAALQAMRAALGYETESPGLLALAERLDGAPEPELQSLRHAAERKLIALAQRAHRMRWDRRAPTAAMEAELAGLPEPDPGTDANSALGQLDKLVRLRRDVAFADGWRDELPDLYARVRKHYDRALEAATKTQADWPRIAEPPEEPAGLPDEAEEAAAARPARERTIATALHSSIPHLLAVANSLSGAEWEWRRVAVGLALRFGAQGSSPHAVVDNWRRTATEAAAKSRRGARLLREQFPNELAAVLAELEGSAAPAAIPDVEPEWFIERWSTDLTAAQRRLLRGEEPNGETAPETDPEPVPPAAPTPTRTRRPRTLAPAPRPTKPPGPSLWNEHLRPFLLENWYVAIGALMVVVGSSLFAYFTWDRHWAIRYTVLPALLGGFTFTLAWLGGWLEERDETLRGTAAVLRGAAIGLLPINFMTVALLAGDPAIGRPGPVVAAVAAAYIAVFGFGLRRWCARVHPGLASLLGGTLLGLCALVVLRPVAVTFAVGADSLRTLLGAGFYLAFGCVAGAVVAFTRRVLTPELARENRVPWFFGATLLLTFLQVFVWIHATMGHLPRVTTYAPMVIGAGALLLHVERRVLDLAGKSDRLQAESFLGFALILLGLVMAQGDPWIRVAGFALAGVAWLSQTAPRQHLLHAWIGLTLLALGGASFALVPGFPPPARPWVGLLLAIGAGTVARTFHVRGKIALATAAADLQVSLLAVTSAVAVLAQWHAGSEPLWTAAALLACAALLAWRAHRDGRQRWLLTAAVVVAAALPYLGCVDLSGRTLHGNTMVFGLAALSLLWIGLDFVAPTKQTRAARSTVLWFYGALAVAGMVMRVLLERGTPGDVLAHRAFMDHAGPLMAAVALGFATYWSRSLVPAGMAAVILIILFPELRTRYRGTFESLGWGSGLGSAMTALALVALCFFLRRRNALRELGPGDHFADGRPFPYRRHDWTLFTWPIAASALFLLGKTATLTLLRNFDAGLTAKAAVAQFAGGVGWLLLAAYGRRRKAAAQGVRLGFVQLFVGVALLYDVAGPGFHPSAAVLWYGLLVQGLAIGIRHGAARRWAWLDDLVAAPARTILRHGTVWIGGLLLAALLVSSPTNWTYALGVFLAAQCVVHGAAKVRQPPRRYGLLLILLLWVGALRLTAPEAWLLGSSVRVSLMAVTAGLVLAVQAAHAFAETRPALFERCRALLLPAQGWAACIATVLGILVLRDSVAASGARLDGRLFLAVAGAVFATSRGNRSGVLAVLGFLVGYATICLPVLDEVAAGAARRAVLLTPWRWAAFGLAVAAATWAGQRLHRRVPWLLSGRRPLELDPLSPPHVLAVLAGACATGAALFHLGTPALRDATGQIPAPYLGAATFAVLAAVLRATALLHGTAVLLAVANVHAVRVLAGPWLSGHGVTSVQLVALGLVATAAVALLVRRLVRNERIVAVADRTMAAGAALVLVLLAAQYVARPDVGAFNSVRLFASGVLAWLAALALRELARRPRGPRTVPPEIAESGYHLGLTVALWCVALLVPALRRPAAALIALSVPFFFFVARAEAAHRRTDRRAANFARTATILGLGLLALYLLRSVFQVVLFPGTPVLTVHYHVNAPLVMLLGLGLLRLHAITHGFWLAFHGGVALMAGSYFALTAAPGFSPFENAPGAAVRAGWVAIALGHFWTAATTRRSPLRTGLLRLAALDESTWHTLRRGWGVLLLVATQLPPLHAAFDATLGGHTSTYAIAPLLAGAASIVLHHGMLRRLRVYYAAAAAELLVALHLDFVTPSLVPWRAVVWILIGSWTAMSFAGRVRNVAPALIARAAWAGAGLVFAHVLVHRPYTPSGLGAFAAALALLLATPQPSGRMRPGESDRVALLGLAPAWLAYFAALANPPGAHGWFAAWPVLTGAAALLATGAAASALSRRHGIGPRDARPAPEPPLLMHRLFAVAQERGDAAFTAALNAAFALAAGVLVLHYEQPYEPRTLVLLCGLFAACATGFVLDGRQREAMLPHWLLQLSCLGFFVAIRRQLVLTTDFWSVHYDVWAACAVTVALAGAKQVFELGPRERNVPVTTSIFLLPVAALLWTVVYGLGTDVALLIVGVHSLVYAFLGRDDRESPYHLVAVGGFVAFVILVLASRLELRSLQAYTIPAGLGVLVLAQLFRASLGADTLALARLAAVVAMIGTAGYEALLDERYPIGFHAVLVVLGVLAMALGGFLRVRLYLVAGAAAVLVALGSILYRGLAGLERAARMSTIGVLVLVIGSLLVAGAIYYKTHRTALNARLDRLRARLGEWD